MNLDTLEATFGDRLQRDVPLASYTAARLGGPAEALLAVHNADELAQAVRILWAEALPFYILGGGSNVLVSDAGLQAVVLLNRARRVHFDNAGVRAESGANLGAIARQAAARGLGGLEWAVNIPGTLGGAVFGNAGAHGGDIARQLQLAEILHPEQGILHLTSADLGYGYRTSALKRGELAGIVLQATLRLQPAPHTEIQARMAAFTAHRRQTQPPGASLGSMFKNPAGDYAGRLIEAAGLKGLQIGGAQISPQHANFFINTGQATASDIFALIQQTRETVQQQFGITLELEIELLGEF
ncbi:MAG: UDP-N-acetylmuramate dehydrogenase [Anaerolineales bacterium]